LSILQWTTRYFERHQIDSPRTDAELLLAHSLNLRRLDLYLRYDQPLSDEELSGFKALIKRRLNREPVAYIVGSKEFWSLDFEVNPSVLIPRPETEGLVEAALDFIPAREDNPDPIAALRVLELGTGSGAVIISLAHQRQGHGYIATDMSMEALKIAQTNARRHLSKHAVDFIRGHWFAPLSSNTVSFDLILSNPPYIPNCDIPLLAPEIHRYEPRMALDGGTDGLRDLFSIIKHAPEYLKPGGMMLLEIGHNQFGALHDFAIMLDAYERIEVRKDYAGLDRVVSLRTKPATS
jgi:release factor glutamine methyltransferase